MARNGFIKLDRKMLDWGWYKDVKTKTLFIHLLLIANWSDSEFMGYKIEPGQVATSYGRLADETGLTVQEVRTAIAHLEKTGEIIKKSTQQLTLLTICKYRVYQGLTSEEQQTINKRPTNNQQHYKKNKKNKNNNRQAPSHTYVAEPPKYQKFKREDYELIQGEGMPEHMREKWRK